MADKNDDQITVSNGSGLRDLFPGYFPPTEQERRLAYKRGIVSLDANALLDLYRFTPKARDELFGVLETLRPRLFITHQAALEFHRNRLDVVDERLGAIQKKCSDIESQLQGVTDQVREFANRYQIDSRERQNLIDMVEALSSRLTVSIIAAGAYDVAREQVRDATDPVLERLSKLVAGRIGAEPTSDETRQALKEAERRKNERIPPGYMDAKKGEIGRAAGDYLVWRQLINEARLHARQVLLVSNEKKEDWVLIGRSNEILGPRPELVLEMQKEANSALHTVTVVGLLKDALQYLDATVSASTIREAESLPSYPQGAKIVFTIKAMTQFDTLPTEDQKRLIMTLELIRSRLEMGQALDNWPSISVDRKEPDLYLLRWSPDGRAMLRIDYSIDATTSMVAINVITINRKRTQISSARNPNGTSG